MLALDEAVGVYPGKQGGTAEIIFSVLALPDRESRDFFGAFRLNQNPWFYQGWVKKPWQIKTSMIR